MKPLFTICTIFALGIIVIADPAFLCFDKRIGRKDTYNFKDYQSCARDCSDCQVYEHMCLERYDQFNFTLNHRSIEAESRCNPPQCICNSESQYIEQSNIILKRVRSMGEITLIPLPDYQELSLNQVGSYEFNLIQQFNQTSDDNRSYWHPFHEDITQQDKLRRIKTSPITDWSVFINKCINASKAEKSKAPKSLKDLDPNSKDVPEATLVCDLHYDNNWTFRRRFAKRCSDVNKNTRPCDGTFACICQHGEEEFYRVSKTMPVVPVDYKGLNTTLSETHFQLAIETTESKEDEEWSIILIAIIAGSATLGTILLCCCCYFCAMYCANRNHRVTYLEKKPARSATMSKKSTKKEPIT